MKRLSMSAGSLDVPAAQRVLIPYRRYELLIATVLFMLEVTCMSSDDSI